MAICRTEAVMLKSFNWSESSRTVVFFSRNRGKIPLIDKGGRSLKSKRGKLLPFARMEITYYASEKETSGYIREAELTQLFELTGDGALGRLAYASAGCELLYILLPENEVNEELYRYFISFLAMMDKADKQSLPGLFLAFFLHLLSQLGFYPSLTHCAGCSKKIELDSNSDNVTYLGPQRGGIVCSTCQKPGDYYIPISSDGLKTMQALQVASLTEAATMPIGYNNAAGLLDMLSKFLSYQTQTKSDLKSLEFLEKLKNSQLHL